MKSRRWRILSLVLTGAIKSSIDFFLKSPLYIYITYIISLGRDV